MTAGDTEHVDTVVIGGGQCGLAAGYFLQRAGRSFTVLDAHPRVGDAWRTRWDSLHLFTHNRFNNLPGMPFPGPAKQFTTKDAMADYLEAYAERFRLPVRLGSTVTRLGQRDGRWVVSTGTGQLTADNVVVATAAPPRVPELAEKIGPGIVQLHSSRYRRPSDLPPGPVLLVGAANSGAEIAVDVAPARPAILAGRDVGQVPQLNWRFNFWLIDRVLTIDTRAGRKMRASVARRGTTPRVRVKRKDLAAAKVRRVPRIEAVQDGKPVASDGTVLDVASIIWCTGFGLDFSWIDLPGFGKGMPEQYRGVVRDRPGLYFVGLPFQYTITSGVVGGVGRDAAYVVDDLCARRPAGTASTTAPRR